jgi:hypothetical protein
LTATFGVNNRSSIMMVGVLEVMMLIMMIIGVTVLLLRTIGANFETRYFKQKERNISEVNFSNVGCLSCCVYKAMKETQQHDCE